MPSDQARKDKRQNQPRGGFQDALQGVLERLRQGLEDLAGSLTPPQRQPIPIPVPTRRVRK